MGAVLEHPSAPGPRDALLFNYSNATQANPRFSRWGKLSKLQGRRSLTAISRSEKARGETVSDGFKTKRSQ